MFYWFSSIEMAVPYLNICILRAERTFAQGRRTVSEIVSVSKMRYRFRRPPVAIVERMYTRQGRGSVGEVRLYGGVEGSPQDGRDA